MNASNSHLHFVYSEPNALRYFMGTFMIFVGLILTFCLGVDSSSPEEPTSIFVRLIFGTPFFIIAFGFFYYKSELLVNFSEDKISKTRSLIKTIHTQEMSLSSLESILIYDASGGTGDGDTASDSWITTVSVAKKIPFEVGTNPLHFYQITVEGKKRNKENVKYIYNIAQQLSELLNLPIKDFRLPISRPK